MILLGKTQILDFVREHEDSRIPVGAWQMEAEDAQWAGPEDVRERYVDAVVQPDRVIFSIWDIYKIDVKAKFKNGVLLVERIWTTSVNKKSRGATKSAAPRSKA